MKIAVSVTVVVFLLVAPAAAEEPERIGTLWIPAAEVLNPDGTLTPEFASPRELPRGDATGQDYVLALGGRVAEWQRQFWDQFGRASAHGLQDGAVMLDDRSYCIGDMKSVWALTQRLFEIPERFGEWADGAEAILVLEVSRIAPGFNRYGEPEILVTVKLLRHLFDPARPFPTEMRFTLPIGEFVAGDTVFCRRATWAGYRPNVGDRLLIGAFVPSRAEYRLIGLDKIQPDSHVFVVAQDGTVRHLDGTSVAERGFPTSLDEFVSRVSQLERTGALDGISLYEAYRLAEAERAAQRRAEVARKRVRTNPPPACVEMFNRCRRDRPGATRKGWFSNTCGIWYNQCLDIALSNAGGSWRPSWHPAPPATLPVRDGQP